MQSEPTAEQARAARAARAAQCAQAMREAQLADARVDLFVAGAARDAARERAAFLMAAAKRAQAACRAEADVAAPRAWRAAPSAVDAMAAAAPPIDARFGGLALGGGTSGAPRRTRPRFECDVRAVGGPVGPFPRSARTPAIKGLPAMPADKRVERYVEAVSQDMRTHVERAIARYEHAR